MTISTHLELTPRNKDIIERLNDHLEESFGYFDKSQIVGIFLQTHTDWTKFINHCVLFFI